MEMIRIFDGWDHERILPLSVYEEIRLGLRSNVGRKPAVAASGPAGNIKGSWHEGIDPGEERRRKDRIRRECDECDEWGKRIEKNKWRDYAGPPARVDTWEMWHYRYIHQSEYWGTCGNVWVPPAKVWRRSVTVEDLTGHDVGVIHGD